MASYKRQIHVEKGEFLEFAYVEGNAPIGLEQVIDKYSREGNYTLLFRTIARDSDKEFTFGIFNSPTIGRLNVTYFPKDKNCIISGQSYGEGIAAVVEDYLNVVGLEPTEIADIEKIEQRIKTELKKQEDFMKTATKEKRKQVYSLYLNLSKRVDYPKMK